MRATVTLEDEIHNTVLALASGSGATLLLHMIGQWPTGLGAQVTTPGLRAGGWKKASARVLREVDVLDYDAGSAEGRLGHRLHHNKPLLKGAVRVDQAGLAKGGRTWIA